MFRISAVIAVFLLAGSAATGISPAQAQQPGKNACSLETCISTCTQRGGRTCDRYCQNEMARRGCGR
jgi:hypothetical protein